MELERDVRDLRIKYDMLYNQVTSQGAAATARASELGEEAFRMANGELMTPDKFMERTRILSQTRASLERMEAKMATLQNENARLQQEKEAAVNESRRYEHMFSRLDRPHSYEVFTSDMHRSTVLENHRLVDEIDQTKRSLAEANTELQILRRRVPIGPNMVSMYLTLDGNIPEVCPFGGCSNFDCGGSMKNFQIHLNSVHRVGCFFVWALYTSIH